MRAAPPAVIRPAAVVVPFGRWRRVRRRLVLRRPSAFGRSQPAARAVVLVRDAGAVRRHMRAREALAEVRMVATMRDEVREGRQLNRKHEQREHEPRGGWSELGERHAAARHRC
jgi:hypothetical protein